MTIEELRRKMSLVNCELGLCVEQIHIELDKLLLEYIDDKEVTELFDQDSLWYS